MSRRGSRVDEPVAYHAEGILYLVQNARFDFLLALPEAANIGSKVYDAMRDETNRLCFNSARTVCGNFLE